MLLLAEKRIVAHQLRDFSEWHQSIAHYGLWCLMVDNPAWQRAIALARAHCERFLHPGYRRQPHVTLFPCGLLDQRFFSQETLARQVDTLAEARLSPFRLELPGVLDSFATAPHLPLIDRDGGLGKIRAVLASVAPEDSPAECYHPHVTLGFYRASFTIDQVTSHLRAFRLPPASWMVNSLAFCRFAAADTQGPLETVLRLPLLFSFFL
jgi:2'-5' RNA ligase